MTLSVLSGDLDGRRGCRRSVDRQCKGEIGSLTQLAGDFNATSVRLDDPGAGLHAKGGIYLRASSFVPGSVMVVLASAHFADVHYSEHPFFYDAGDGSG